MKTERAAYQALKDAARDDLIRRVEKQCHELWLMGRLSAYHAAKRHLEELKGEQGA